MMAAEPNALSRRSFLSFLAPKTTKRSSLSRISSIANEFDGVFWAACTNGDARLFAGDDGMIVNLDDSNWQREQLGTDLPIHAMTSTSNGDVFAVGWLGLICQRNESGWHYVQGGATTRDSTDQGNIRQNLPLFDITTDKKDKLWAVGDQGRVVTYSKGAWEEIDCGHQTNLRSVLALADGSILIGGLGGLLLWFKNDSWQSIETRSHAAIVSMVESSPNEIYLVGGEYNEDDACYYGKLFHFDKQQLLSINVSEQIPRLRRIRQLADQIYICGDQGSAFRVQDDNIIKLNTGVSFDLHDISINSDGLVTFCGDGGCILIDRLNIDEVETDISAISNTEDHRWKIIEQTLTRSILRAVWALSDDCVFAVGDEATIIEYRKGECILHDIPGNVRLHDIWGTSATNIYACGDNATLLHFNGKQWTSVYEGTTDVAFLSILGFGIHDIFVVGDEGHALRYDGLQWRTMETGTPFELYQLWGYDSEHVLAVGGGGKVIRWNGTGWQSFDTGKDIDMYGVWGDRLDRIYIVGLSGTITKFNGRHWEKEHSINRSDLHAITGKAMGPLFAVGSMGTILRKDVTNDNSIWELEDSGTKTTLRAATCTENSVFAVGSNGLIIKKRL